MSLVKPSLIPRLFYELWKSGEKEPRKAGNIVGHHIILTMYMYVVPWILLYEIPLPAQERLQDPWQSSQENTRDHLHVCLSHMYKDMERLLLVAKLTWPWRKSSILDAHYGCNPRGVNIEVLDFDMYYSSAQATLVGDLYHRHLHSEIFDVDTLSSTVHECEQMMYIYYNCTQVMVQCHVCYSNEYSPSNLKCLHACSTLLHVGGISPD